SARVTVKGSVSGGDVVIRANTGLQEIPEIVDIDDYSKKDWAIAKLKEYIDMVPLPVVVKMRDDQSTVTIDAGAIITGSQKVTIESEANAQARAQADFSKEFIGYCKAQAQAEVNVNNGAVITAGDNVLIRSKALAAADLDVTVDNSKNSSFSLVLGVTDTNLTSHATIAEGANITGKNVNIQALGNNYNHVSTKSTNSTDGKLMAMLSLNFTESDVKTEVNGNLTAAGEEITSQKDLNDRLSGGIGVLTRLDSDDLAQVVAGIGGTVTDAKEKDIDDDKAKSAKDMIIDFFQKNYQQKTEKAEDDGKNDSGANKNLQIAAACSCSKVDNDVNTIIGSTADLKSGLDLNVKSELVETAQTQTRSWIEGDSKEGEPPVKPSTAISAAVSVGLYDNSATTTFAGQSDAKCETVISSSVSYPFLLEPFKDLSAGTFKDGLNLKDSLGQNLDFAKDVLGLMEEMINSWTISTASGETTGVAGAVTYLEYNNNAATNIKNTARINQRVDDARYWSDDQTVAIDAATDLAQIIVVGNFDFGLSQDDLKEIADKRGMPEPGDKSALVDPYGVKSGKAGIGGSILLSYVNNNATANIESGARIHAGSDGKIDVTASNQVTNIEFVQSGGQAGKFGVAGSFALDNETANVLAQVNRGTVLKAGALNIKANDTSSHLNILGGVMRGDGVGIGCSIGINEITRNIGAGIAQPDGSAQGTTSNIVIAGTTNVEAIAKGDILVATVAASLPAKAEDEAPDQSKDTSATTSGAPESGSTGADKSQGKYGIGVSGAVSINEVNDTVKAFVDYSDKITTRSLTVKGTNETNILALTGSVAYTKSSQETSGTLAGAYSQITLNGTTEACVLGTEMDTNSLTLLAERIGNLWAISAGGANSPGKSGIAVAGSVSINNISNNTNAMLDDMKGTVAGPTLLQAKDKSSMHVIAGAEGYGGRGGFGAAVAYNDLQNNTTAKIMNSDWNQKATIELLAQNSIRAGPIDESFVISGNPADNVEIFAVAASLGLSPKGNFGGAGTVAINRIRNTVEVSMIGSTCNITGDGQVTFTGRDDSNIFSIAGAIGGAKNVGIGAAVAYNEIGNKSYTFIDGSTLKNPTALSLITESGGIIKTLSLGASGAQDVALAGSASVNKINNDASAYIKNSTISVINHIYISSTGSAGIGSVAGGFSGAGKAAIGAAIAINYIGSAANPNQIKAYIENSRVTTTDDSNDLVEGHLPGVNLSARDNSTIRSISGGIGVGGAAGLGGAAAYNEVTNVVKAYVQGCKTQGTEIKHINSTGSLTIKGESAATIETISAGGAGGKLGAAGSVSINTIGNTVEAYINDSTVGVEDNVYLLADSDNVIHGYGGALAGGLVGISGAVVVNTVENTTRSYILHSTVTASGTGSNVVVKNWDGDGDESTEDLQGLFVIASCNDLIELYSGAAAGGAGAVAGQTSVSHVKDLTEAFIGASKINSEADFGKWVKVKAHQGTQVNIWAGGLCVSSAGVGAAVDRTLVENTTRAYISDRDENGTDPSSIDSNVYARGLEVIARTRENVNSKLAGVALSGTASGAGAVSVVDFNGNCLAMIARSAIFAQGPVNVYASDKAVLDSKVATFAASGGGSVAGSVVVNTLSNTVKASVLGSNLNATRGIEVKSLGNDKITIMTGGV
ncbi:MAG: hypothetical protein PHE82_07215, partial [Syntrophomonadaceae bacterium]|nr:hypothetical protein [Syntrophomonadaceae bacterium]